MDRSEFGRELGAKGRGTIAWRLHPDYTQRLAETDLRRFDWTKAQNLRGVALALWMVFSSPRVPYRPLFEASDALEIVEVPLTVEHCHALGVHAGLTLHAGGRLTRRARASARPTAPSRLSRSMEVADATASCVSYVDVHRRLLPMGAALCPALSASFR
jgi:hypothetical protein